MIDDNFFCFREDEVVRPREIIIELMDYMINRNLTDFSGGNMAVRVGKKIFMTKSHSADEKRWKLKPDDIIVIDINKNLIEGNWDKYSREGDLHFNILKNFPDINCSLHGNSYFSPLLVSVGLKPIGITEIARTYNVKNIPIVPEEIIPMSPEENKIIIEYFKELKGNGEPLAAIMPYHGLIVAGRDHNEAFALFEAIENNNKFIVDQENLKANIKINRQFLNVDLATEDNSILETYDNKKILTASDIEDIAGRIKNNIMAISKNTILTTLAEDKVSELGISVIKK